MKLVRLLLFFGLIAAVVRAEAPLYTVKFTSTSTFEVSGSTGSASLNFYPETKATKGKRNIVGAGYLTGIEIKTKDPARAAQAILRQICEQTGLMAGYHMKSSLAELEPIVLLQGFSETSTITLLLTPKQVNVFTVTCAYVIDQRPDGSIDGTPAGIAQMNEQLRALTADSIATTLPQKFPTAGLKAENFFRGRQEMTITDPTGKQSQKVSFLLLKKDRDYTVGIYRESEGTWTIIDQPITLRGTGSPHINGRGNGKDLISSIRAINADGKTGTDLYVVDGRIIKKEFAEPSEN
jgi:hypothetical protein